ncbi:radical SAM/SPASM domain-containing protein [Myroides odoratus]|uniref:radical SAM/SPASM domain-containing protein n=1 Tax=Myroides odoratus TaxID=256 RepID=UPI000765D81F|nr:radical SAM protein [Myroides odoratus]
MKNKKFKLSRYKVTTALDQGFTLVYSTRTSQLLRIKSTIFNLIENQKFETINSDVLLELFNSEILIPADEDEFEIVINSFTKATMASSDIFSYTIQPSGNCQLGCGYCGQNHEKLNLTDDQSEKIFEYLKIQLNKHNYKEINITWYGGEPLLGINGIRYLSEKLIRYSKSKGIKYKASIITNGLALKRNIFEELVNLKIYHFQITLDGTELLHDNSRFMKINKGATYKYILKNVINAVKTPIYDEFKCNILIRCNVSKQNYLDIHNLIEEIYKLKLHTRISMKFEPIHDWGNNHIDEKIGLTPEAFGEIEIEYLIKLRQLGFRRNIPLLPTRRFNTCMITSSDSELIDAKGRVTYCWEVPFTPEFDFEDSPFIIGEVNNNAHKKNRKKLPLGDWYQDIKYKKYNTWCKECNFLPVCGGSCPINWYKGNPACPSFKYNFEDRISLQYLDEIKYDFTNS